MELLELNRSDLQWCLRRCPTEVLTVLKKNPRRVSIAGGFIRSCIANEPINDVDLFAASPELAKAIAFDLANHGASINRPPKKVHTTDNAYTIQGFRITPQVIHRWTFEDVMDVIPSFDFTIACAVIFWCSRQNQWQGFCDKHFYSDLAAKRLIYRSPVRDEEPGGSMLRVLKFYQRGYRIPLCSLGAVIARLTKGLTPEMGEKKLARDITRRLIEVDPLLDPSHAAHLPTEGEEITE